MTAESIKDSFKMLQMTDKDIVQILLEEDILVPDTKPDLSKIVSIDGKMKILDKETNNDITRISGKIDLKIMYAPIAETEEFPLIPMDAVINFRHESDYPNYNVYEVDISGNVEHMDYEIINERKLKVKAVANIISKAYQNIQVDLFSVPQDEEMQLLKSDAKYTDIVERKKATLEVKEELSIKEGMPEIGKILNWDINIVENQRQIVSDRAVINAQVQYSILYLSEDSEPMPVFLRESSEFTQFIDITHGDGISESKVDFTIDQSNIRVKKDADENATLFEVNMDVMTNIELLQTKEKEIIVDAYHPKKEIEVKKDNIEFKMLYGKSAANIPIKETLNIPDNYSDLEKIIDITAKVFETGNMIEDNKDFIEGILSINVLYLSNENKVYGFREEIPFRHALEISGLTSDKDIEREIYIRKIDFEAINAKQVEINADIYIKSTAYKKDSYEVLTDVTLSDQVASMEESPSIILYIAKKGDNLWKIAKKHHTTIDEIRNINNISEESDVKPGEKIILLKDCR